MSPKLAPSAAQLAELHALPDDAYLSTREAAAFLSLASASLNWFRWKRRGPAFVKVGPTCVRYRVGDLRKYARRIDATPSRAEA